MSEALYSRMALADTGYVEAAAGCGKTEAIARTIVACTGKQLVLTHTLAGVDALRRRFRKLRVDPSKVHVDTIAGWSWGWVRKYPATSSYGADTDVPEWALVYASATRLLDAGFVRSTISNSYAGVLVDEYQDCTKSMHQLLRALATIIPCRVLGDDLQGVFDFNEPLVDWADVKADYVQNLGTLDVPHRWLLGKNEPLGQWILDAREPLRSGREPDYRGAPITRFTFKGSELTGKLHGVLSGLKGSVCVIRAKNRALAPGLETMLASRGYRILEANDLRELRRVVDGLSHVDQSRRAAAEIAFLTRAYGKIGSNRAFIRAIIAGAKLRPTSNDRKALVEKHQHGATAELLYDLLSYLDAHGAVQKLPDSIRSFRCALERSRESGADLRSACADEIRSRKYDGRSGIGRCVGSTLLVKGLQFAHVVILRNTHWLEDKWGSHRDLYVALSRGARSVTLIDVS